VDELPHTALSRIGFHVADLVESVLHLNDDSGGSKQQKGHSDRRRQQSLPRSGCRVDHGFELGDSSCPDNALPFLGNAAANSFLTPSHPRQGDHNHQ
jgi:hypothetical protein